VWVLAAGCDREPLAIDCAIPGPGALVVSEIRGPQNGVDGYGEWLELYNASGDTIELTGLRVSLLTLDGGSETSFALRGDGVTAPAGGFVVLGRFPAGEEPAHVDLGYADLYDRALPGGAALELEACGDTIDRVIYRSLPSAGTYSLSGDRFPPDGFVNDEETAWCTDATEDADTPQQGIRGTPGERNRPCA